MFWFSDENISFETINTFLSEVFEDDLRYDALVSYLKKSPSDVVCLQEVWNDLKLYKLREDLTTAYPFSFSSIHSMDGFLSIPVGQAESKCDEDAVNKVLQCSSSSCKKKENLLDYYKCKFQVSFLIFFNFPLLFK